MHTKIVSRAKNSRLGRPSKEESRLRHEQLLECALDFFLERGLEQTTMVEIATAVGMSKRTVYSYYEDKEQLFRTAVQRAIDRYTVPYDILKAVESDDLEETLKAVARIRIDNVSTPTGIRLQRILNAQAYRFPDLFRESFGVVTRPTIRFLSELFERFTAEGQVDVEDPERAAVAFLSLVVSGPARMITMGRAPDEVEIQAGVDFSVQLFLNGIRRR
ncbi:MAG TPA: TetR/AcrR family transcriptional regulator [Porticoccaceae bacterium]